MCEKAPTDPRPEIPSLPETAIDFGFDRREAVDEPALDRGLGFGDDRLQKEVAPDHERVVAPREAARPHEIVALRRQADVSVLSIKERGPQLLFQVADLFADRRLRDMKQLRRPAEPSVFRNRGEVAQVS